MTTRLPAGNAASAELARPTPYPVTPDGRYFVVRGRLWRCSDPSLTSGEHSRLVRELMEARRNVGTALRSCDERAEADARRAVDAAKQALGERGPAWWSDGAPDYNRKLVANTPYRDWLIKTALDE